MRLLPFVLCALLSIAAAAVDAASQSYVLQRRMGVADNWEAIASVTVSRAFANAPAILRHEAKKEGAAGPDDHTDLSSEKKNMLGRAQFVYYRLLPKGDGDDKRAVSLAITPCSLVRGFEALDSRTIVLREFLRVAVGPNTTVLGLQATSETNTFHTKLLNGDECDVSILSLFPTVRTRVHIGLVTSTSPRSLPDYTDLTALAKKDAPATTGGAEKKRKKRGAAATASASQEDNSQEEQRAVDGGQDDEEEEEEDKRSFLQKYWLYLVIPFVMSLVQNALVK